MRCALIFVAILASTNAYAAAFGFHKGFMPENFSGQFGQYIALTPPLPNPAFDDYFATFKKVEGICSIQANKDFEGKREAWLAANDLVYALDAIYNGGKIEANPTVDIYLMHYNEKLPDGLKRITLMRQENSVTLSYTWIEDRECKNIPEPDRTGL